MARAVGISVSSVQRIWRAHGLQPHRLRQFKFSNDVAQANSDPRPFRWTTDPDKIIAAVRRGHQLLNSLH